MLVEKTDVFSLWVDGVRVCLESSSDTSAFYIRRNADTEPSCSPDATVPDAYRKTSFYHFQIGQEGSGNAPVRGNSNCMIRILGIIRRLNRHREPWPPTSFAEPVLESPRPLLLFRLKRSVRRAVFFFPLLFFQTVAGNIQDEILVLLM